MKLTVNLDSHAVLTQPAPMRIKAGCFVPIEIAFTRAAQSASLPQGAVIELFLTPLIPWPGGVFAYANHFTCAADNLYTGALQTGTNIILDTLARTYIHAPAHTPQIETNGEITWSFDGRKHRSVTFPVVIEAPVANEPPAAAPDPELYPAPGDIALNSALEAHISSANNPHAVTKAQVGLGNVDNTSDLDKPVSTAQAAALDAHASRSDNPHAVSKAQVGLANVDNTSDAAKPISAAQAAALVLKADKTEVAAAKSKVIVTDDLDKVRPNDVNICDIISVRNNDYPRVLALDISCYGYPVAKQMEEWTFYDRDETSIDVEMSASDGSGPLGFFSEPWEGPLTGAQLATKLAAKINAAWASFATASATGSVLHLESWIGSWGNISLALNADWQYQNTLQWGSGDRNGRFDYQFKFELEGYGPCSLQGSMACADYPQGFGEMEIRAAIAEEIRAQGWESSLEMTTQYVPLWWRDCSVIKSKSGVTPTGTWSFSNSWTSWTAGDGYIWYDVPDPGGAGDPDEDFLVVDKYRFPGPLSVVGLNGRGRRLGMDDWGYPRMAQPANFPWIVDGDSLLDVDLYDDIWRGNKIGYILHFLERGNTWENGLLLGGFNGVENQYQRVYCRNELKLQVAGGSEYDWKFKILTPLKPILSGTPFVRGFGASCADSGNATYPAIATVEPTGWKFGGELRCRWQKSPDGTVWNDIQGAMYETLYPDPCLIGHRLRCALKAVNCAGSSDWKWSSAGPTIQAGPGYWPTLLNDGLFASWVFDPTNPLLDTVAGRNLTNTGSCTFERTGAAFGKAKRLTGTNLKFLDSALGLEDFGYSTKGPFTIATSVWLNEDWTGDQPLFGLHTSMSHYWFASHIGTSHGGIAFKVGSVEVGSSGFAMRPKEWHFLVCRFNGTEMGLCHNGAWITKTIGSNNVNFQGSDQAGAVFRLGQFGHKPQWASQNLKGCLGPTFVWRKFLSNAEVEQIPRI